MSKVYVVEMPMRWDKEERCLVPARDFSKAERFGEVVHLLPPDSVNGTRGREIEARLVEGLRDFTRDDYLVAGAGHPLALAAATMIAGFKCAGRVRMLHWQRDEGDYVVAIVDVNPKSEERANGKVEVQHHRV